MKCDVHTKYFTSCNHPEQWFFSQWVTREEQEKKLNMMPRKITITGKGIGICPLEMGIDATSPETDEGGVNTRTEPEL